MNGYKDFTHGIKSYFILRGWDLRVRESMRTTKTVGAASRHTGEPVGGYDELGYNSTPEQKIINDGINASKGKAWRCIIGGFFEFACGICFLYLGAGELHYFDDDLNPVINAIIVMQVALAYFLYLMVSDIVSTYCYIQSMQKLLERANDFNKHPVQLMDNLDLNGHYCSILGIEGSWDTDKSSDLYGVDAANIKSLVQGDDKFKKIVSKKTYWDLIEKRITLGKQIFILILNLIAGHGFNLGVVAFKFQTNSNYFATLYRHGLSVPTADFYGNFSGDLAWTVEPLFLIFADKLVAHMVTYRMELESFRIITSTSTPKPAVDKKMKRA